MDKRRSLIILISIIIYAVSTWISYAFFAKHIQGANSNTYVSPVDKTSLANDYEAIMFDPNAPKTEVCPLNGAKYSSEQRAWWEKHRPLGVMIENHQEARPQSGLNAADVTYEAVAEGGITRTLNIYYCQDAGIIGPVRSARTYFLDYISEYGKYPLYAHVGGANMPGPADALGQISDYGWTGYNDLNQFSIGYPTFKRDESRLGRAVATEHTMYSTTTKLWNIAQTRKLTNVDKKSDSWEIGFVPYKFKDDPALSDRPVAQTVNLSFWSNQPAYDVSWTYDKQSNLYMRKNGGVSHLDRNTGKQLSAKNVIILFERESNANDGYPGNVHLLYGTKGSGKAIFFLDGKEVRGTWKKESRIARTRLFTAGGSELVMTRGKIWFEILPIGADVITK